MLIENVRIKVELNRANLDLENSSRDNNVNIRDFLGGAQRET